MTGGVGLASVRLAPVLGAVAENRAASVEAIASAAAGGADIIVLPELCTSGYAFHDADEARPAAEAVPGPTTEAWTRIAAATGAVVVGGILEVDDLGRLRNTAAVVDGSGVLARYRKLHLWGDENLIFRAGDERAPVVATAAGRIGVGVCYDLWFPELLRDLALRGAEVIAVPANLTGSETQPGLPHVDVMVAVAAAHVNRVHLVLADRCGDERGADWVGAACIVDASGQLVAPPPPGREPAVATARVDLDAARDKTWGPRNDLVGDRRMDVYGG